ncbi:hypothetical protein [Polyangium aurulentum]|uniref:hypothetical protein n=1 Tax=Polyangium aurulentum TaxID=2567896 RepID=UPI0010AEDE06|nr:hypothetical protein [Polyangium aurulentum]UQA60641.1 hypothetical protein E8A73_009260 [Polyangium aurulentum]
MRGIIMSPRPWIVLSNGPVQRLEDNLLCVHGPTPQAVAGLERTMTVMKRSDGRLVIHNAIALDEAGMTMIEALGEPAFLIVPNAFHRMDAHPYKVRYPALRVLCPRPAVKAVRKVVEVDGELTDLPPDPAVQVEVLEGFRLGEGVFTVRSGPERERATLVFNDILLNLDRMPGVAGFLFRLVGGRLGAPGLHPIQKRLSDRRRLREHLRRFAEVPGLCRIIPGHGAVIEGGAAELLRELARDGE